ncbi:ubiquitin-conjugating enzyme E2 2-like [Chrysoperla carnea]|uniref:ubiquitin-conjugating enzyme E2 2-like n=1 Tax=Chrysoperla carnea TaxID=189513 RepID=UPI001D07C675|nr:ubiquitin-conjugating enzyme E2 2-like [Chrysoperla carnea]
MSTQNTACKRLQIDLKRMLTEQIPGIYAFPTSDIYVWRGVIFGPADTPFEDGEFKLRMEFCAQYPFKASKVYFTTPIFHPNIQTICLDILSNRWSSTYDVLGILTSISVSSFLLFYLSKAPPADGKEAGKLLDGEWKK